MSESMPTNPDEIAFADDLAGMPEAADLDSRGPWVRALHEAQIGDYPLWWHFRSSQDRTTFLRDRNPSFVAGDMDAVIGSMVGVVPGQDSADKHGLRFINYGAGRGIVLGTDAQAVVRKNGVAQVDFLALQPGDVRYLAPPAIERMDAMQRAYRAAQLLEDEEARGVLLGMMTYFTHAPMGATPQMSSLVHALWSRGYDGTPEDRDYYESLLDEDNGSAFGGDLAAKTEYFRDHFVDNHMLWLPAAYDKSDNEKLTDNYQPVFTKPLDVERLMAKNPDLKQYDVVMLNLMMAEDRFGAMVLADHLFVRGVDYREFVIEEDGVRRIDINAVFDRITDDGKADSLHPNLPHMKMAIDGMVSRHSELKTVMMDDFIETFVEEGGSYVAEARTRLADVFGIELHIDQDWMKHESEEEWMAHDYHRMMTKENKQKIRRPDRRAS